MLSASANRALYGSSVTLTVTVTPQSAAGSITFYAGVAVVGTSRIIGGQATLATSLLRQGGSLDEIGELLRHQSPNTTAIYAKVDVTALHTLALPWPGGGR